MYTLQQIIPQSRMYNIPRLLINSFRMMIYIMGAYLYFSQQLSLSKLTAIL